jgi:hypothetical protein
MDIQQNINKTAKTMNTKEFKFNGSIINFEIDNKNVMVNATQMAKVFDKFPKDFLILEQTELFIRECCKDENYGELLDLKDEVRTENFPPENHSEKGISPFQTPENRKDSFLKVIHGGKNSGTWMHRVLALKFAAWLNPAFELWIFKTIDCLLFDSYREDEERLKTIAGIQDKITEKEKELKNSPVLKEIEALKKDEQREKRIFEMRKRNRIAGFRTIFPENEMEGKEKSTMI